jgi:bla regulator protein BlaR1
MTLKYLSAMWTSLAPALGNHLWQSTLFAVAAGLLTLVLRKNHARARYGLWLAASLKFLVPFALLTEIGSRLSWSHVPAETGAGFYFVMEEMGQPFTQRAVPQAPHTTFFSGLAHLLPALLLAAWFCGFIVLLFVWFVRWKKVSATLRDGAPLREGREVEALRRLERLGGIRKKIEILLSRESMEPGILGVFRPVLVWPEGISTRLEDAHLHAILAHEVWHVRRNDNLTAAIHMVVEAIFWFHPLVWWVGARMVEERERACDEEVLHLGNQPQIYAESILKVCEFCVGSPLSCVSGVTGSDLKKRIVSIMNKNVARKINLGKKLLLSTTGVVAIALPILFGLARPTHSMAASPAPNSAVFAATYQQVTVTPGDSGNGVIQSRIWFTPGSIKAENQPLKELIRWAYGVQDSQIFGGPDWISTARFNIEAKLDSATAAEFEKLGRQQQKSERDRMFQTLLEEHFHLVLHRDTKDLPALVMVIAKNGPKIQKAKPGDTYPDGLKGPDGTPGGPHKMNMGANELTFQAFPMKDVANLLTMHLGQTVLDRTGLAGDYDFKLHWAAAQDDMAAKNGVHEQKLTEHTMSADNSEAAIAAAMEEQLGLKLEQQTAPLPIVIVDRAEKPSAN